MFSRHADREKCRKPPKTVPILEVVIKQKKQAVFAILVQTKGVRSTRSKSSLHNNGKEKEFTQGAEYDIGPAVAACEREIGIEKAVMLFPSAVGNVDNWHVMRSKRLHAFACESDGAARSLFPEAPDLQIPDTLFSRGIMWGSYFLCRVMSSHSLSL